MMKIVYFVDYFEPHVWGVETAFGYIARGMVDLGHDVTILTCHHDSYLPSTQICDGMTIHRMWSHRYSYMVRWLIRWYGMSADIFHGSSRAGAFIVWLLSSIRKISRKKIRTIVTIHDYYGKLWFRYRPILWLLYRLVERTMYRLPYDQTITVSDYNQTKLPTSSIVINHGIDTSVRKITWWSKKYDFLYYGRSTREKWLWVLIWALGQLYLGWYTFRAVIIAPKTFEWRWQIDHDILSQLIDAWVLYRYEPMSIPQLIETISSSRNVVVPSLNEWFGFGAAQACAMDIPVVVSDAWALPQTISGYHIITKAWSISDLKQWLYRALQEQRDFVPKKMYNRNQSIESHHNIYTTIYGTHRS